MHSNIRLLWKNNNSVHHLIKLQLPVVIVVERIHQPYCFLTLKFLNLDVLNFIFVSSFNESKAAVAASVASRFVLHAFDGIILIIGGDNGHRAYEVNINFGMTQSSVTTVTTNYATVDNCRRDFGYQVDGEIRINLLGSHIESRKPIVSLIPTL